MARDNLIVSLDLGTSQTRFLIVQSGNGEKNPRVLAVGQIASTGLRKGSVIDIEETVKGIAAAKSLAERISGHTIDRAYVSISGHHINCLPSRGMVAVSRADGEISGEDVERVINAATIIHLPPNREILHVLPRHFIVDGQEGIKDPSGMNGSRLEVNAFLIHGLTPLIKNLSRCLEGAEVEVNGLVFSPLAAAQAVLSKRQKELGVLVLDLGAGTTGLTVFEEGDIIHTQVLPIGGMHITNDIAIGLRVGIDLAEKIKVQYGSVLPEEINKKEVVDLSKIELGDEEGLKVEGLISRKQIAEIIEARTSEILDLVNQELKKIDRQGLLPAGVVLVGGGAKMPGIVDLTKQKLGLPAQVGFPIELSGVIDQIDDPSFATAVGLTFWGMDEQRDNVVKPKFFSPRSSISSFGKGINKFVKWLRDFLP